MRLRQPAKRVGAPSGRPTHQPSGWLESEQGPVRVTASQRGVRPWSAGLALVGETVTRPFRTLTRHAHQTFTRAVSTRKDTRPGDRQPEGGAAVLVLAGLRRKWND
jgi:hypothetical protein